MNYKLQRLTPLQRNCATCAKDVLTQGSLLIPTSPVYYISHRIFHSLSAMYLQNSNYQTYYVLVKADDTNPCLTVLRTPSQLKPGIFKLVLAISAKCKRNIEKKK